MIEDMISTYYTNNVAADENFLDHMYRIVSDDHLDDGFMKKIGDNVAKMMMIKLLLVDVDVDDFFPNGRSPPPFCNHGRGRCMNKL